MSLQWAALQLDRGGVCVYQGDATVIVVESLRAVY